MSNDSSVEQKLRSPRPFVLLLSSHTAALGLCHTPLKLPLIISLQLSQKRLQRVLSGSLIVTSVYVFSVEIPDRFESPDLLEPDC